MLGSETLSNMDPVVVQNLIEFLQYWWTPMKWAAYLIGLALIASGVFFLAQETKRAGGFVMMIVGAVLFNMPAAFDVLSMTFLSERAPTNLEYTAPDSEDALYITAIIRMATLFGGLVFIKSMLLFKDYANEKRSQMLYSAFTYLAGSVVCLNIENWLRLSGRILGGEVERLVNLLI